MQLPGKQKIYIILVDINSGAHYCTLWIISTTDRKCFKKYLPLYLFSFSGNEIAYGFAEEAG